MGAWEKQVVDVAYISGSSIPSYSANSVHVMKMCAALARADFRVTLYHHPGEAASAATPFAHYGVDPRFELIPVRWPRIKGFGGLYYAWQVQRSLSRRPEVDVLYSRHALSVLAAAGGGRNLIFEAHALPGNAVQRIAEARLFRRSNFSHLVVISEALRREYQKLFPWLPHDRIVVAHDAADPLEDRPDAEPREGREAAVLTVGYAGSMGPGRGIDLVEALAEALPDVSFHMFGGSPAEVAARRERAPGNLHFHGHLPHGELADELCRLDVLLAPYEEVVYTAGGRNSTLWMSPLKLFEYMATGRAIVCSDLPVLREVIASGHNGLLVPPGDLAGWSEALRRLMDPVVRERLGAMARETFEREHTWSARVKQVLQPIMER